MDDEAPEARWYRAKPRFVHYRIAALVLVLVCVLAYAARDRSVRAARTEWKRPLDVAVIVVRVGAVDESAIAQLRARVPHLEQVVARQFHRYRQGGLDRPVYFHVLGPSDASEPPIPGDDSLNALARHSWAMFQWRGPIDVNVQAKKYRYDARVYLVVHPPKNGAQFVEGASEQGGYNGLTAVELDATMIDFALFVTTHETMHLLGATDLYDATGKTLDAPVAANHVELMGHGKTLPNGASAPPDSLDQMWIGARTAREIGWAAPVE